jgi:hypothetical protein
MKQTKLVDNISPTSLVFCPKYSFVCVCVCYGNIQGYSQQGKPNKKNIAISLVEQKRFL